jgi:hypothetical protein
VRNEAREAKYDLLVGLPWTGGKHHMKSTARRQGVVNAKISSDYPRVVDLTGILRLRGLGDDATLESASAMTRMDYLRVRWIKQVA